jgi:hypothetical protein
MVRETSPCKTKLEAVKKATARDLHLLRRDKMAKTRSEYSTDNEPETTIVERPLKRPKVAASAEADVVPRTPMETRIMTDDEDEELPRAPTNVPRASDLYLDTASAMFRKISVKLAHQ